ncbi:Holliday junction branch migration protein RuvA [Stackebrandtia soli]|uniref:Holliday junction branch migration protein RuvA n=1 Tax=Stackebrandtia soli TaxID=1892856 RepID=UPI0039E97B05
MIASINGTVLTISAERAVIEVGGVGLSVKATPGTLANLRVGSQVSLHTTLIVREESLTLYGFDGADQRDLFELLQTASGVGPRLAQAALAVHPPAVIQHAIATGDTATLTRIPGVGKKGADRLVLELKDRVGSVVLPHQDTKGALARPPAWRDQVQQGLMALGWSAKDASRALTAIDADTDDTTPVDVPSLLKQAIRLLGRTK